MLKAIKNRLTKLRDVINNTGAGTDGWLWSYDHSSAKTTLVHPSTVGVTDHGALSGRADDDHTQYLLATGARAGATSHAQAFTSGMATPSLKAISDSAQGLLFQNAAGTADIITVDTTNDRVALASVVGVNFTPVANQRFRVNGSDDANLFLLSGTVTINGLNAIFTLDGGGSNVQALRMAATFDSDDNTSTYYVINNAVRVSGSADLTDAYGNFGQLQLLGGHSGTVTNATMFTARPVSKSGSGSVTNIFGFVVEDDSTATGNTRGFVGKLDSGSGKHNLYIEGSADNYINGNIGVKVAGPTAAVDINDDCFRIRQSKTPASASATGNQGDIAWDSDYIYVCTATDTWKRTAISTW